MLSKQVDRKHGRQVYDFVFPPPSDWEAMEAAEREREERILAIVRGESGHGQT